MVDQWWIRKRVREEERKIVREKTKKQQTGGEGEERQRDTSLINNYSIIVHTIPLIGLYSSKCQNYLAFDAS